VHFFTRANSAEYWDLPWVQYLYIELGKKETLENKVDLIWSNIFSNDFPANEAYVLHVRNRLNKHTAMSPDIMVRQLQNGNPFTIMIMENKRGSLVGQSAVWAGTFEEMTEYLDIELTSAKNEPKFQVGLVAIGRYVRFYRREGPGEPQNYPGTNGKAFEIWNDKMEVQDILSKIKAETKKT
jgi:hypothetical protein